MAPAATAMGAGDSAKLHGAGAGAAQSQKEGQEKDLVMKQASCNAVPECVMAASARVPRKEAASLVPTAESGSVGAVVEGERAAPSASGNLTPPEGSAKVSPQWVEREQSYKEVLERALASQPLKEELARLRLRVVDAELCKTRAEQQHSAAEDRLRAALQEVTELQRQLKQQGEQKAGRARRTCEESQELGQELGVEPEKQAPHSTFVVWNFGQAPDAPHYSDVVTI